MKPNELKSIRKALKLTQQEFADELEVNQAYISELETGRKPITDNIVDSINQKFSKKLGYTVKNTDKSGGTSNVKESNFGTGVPNVLIVPIKAYGGFLSGYEDTVYLDSMEKIYFPFIKGHGVAFEVKGFSMLSNEKGEKSYNENDWIITTEIENPSWLTAGSDYVFQTIDGLIFKRYEKIENEKCYLRSLNDEYNPVQPLPVKSIKKIYFVEKVIK